MIEMENDLPFSKNLAVSNLSSCFKNVVNSYKFYWFLAILDHIAENDNTFISLNDLSMRMLSSVWYPLDFFKLSFGKQDGFKDLAKLVSSHIAIDNSLTAPSIIWQIQNQLPLNVSSKITHSIKQTLKRWVTYRFLTPFFANQLKGLKDQAVNNKIQLLSNDHLFAGYAPYRIVDDGILINENWLSYFKHHQYVLRGFIKWHLVKFLQKNNPNVTGLTEKLSKPAFRDLKAAKGYWTKYLDTSDALCIFSGLRLPKSGFSLDHFVPWSYVAHDQIWNIVPTFKSVNSSKSNSLPSVSKYLGGFCELQFKAFKFHLDMGNEQILEDYSSLFQNFKFHEINYLRFENAIRSEIENSIRIATNLGFSTNYIY